MPVNSPVFYLTIEDGKSTLHKQDKWRDMVKCLPDGVYMFTLEKPRKEHSDDQRKYYHGYIVKTFANEYGCSEKAMHQTLKEWGKIETTTSLSMTKYREYITEVKMIFFDMYGWEMEDINDVKIT